MTYYLAVLAVVFIANVVPAFAPPTWSILVFFTLNYELRVIPMIIVGVIAAASGRYILALLFRRFRHKLPHWYLINMENAATHLTKSNAHLGALFLAFFISPLSSAQLFEAAGIMKNIALRPLVLAFAAGRIITYTIYVSGARLLKESSFGDILLANLKSPQAVATQILLVLALVGLGMVKWKPHLPNDHDIDTDLSVKNDAPQ